MRFLFVLVGGAIGALMRYLLSGATHQFLSKSFPWGTLCVNLVGSFFIGFLWGHFEYVTISPNLRIFIFIGILGGFTTFSSFALESLRLFQDGEISHALSNVLVSNLLGLLLVFLGMAIARYLFGLLS